jgi:hypothetical protein
MSNGATAHFFTFPRTQAPVLFIPQIVAAFRCHDASIGTTVLFKGLSSDAVMAVLRDDLCKLGFEIEAGKATTAKLKGRSSSEKMVVLRVNTKSTVSIRAGGVESRSRQDEHGWATPFIVI